MTEKELLTKYRTEELKKEHDSARKLLDELRRSRKARGGVGAPLDVPAHLSEARQTIILTDALKGVEEVE